MFEFKWKFTLLKAVGCVRSRLLLFSFVGLRLPQAATGLTSEPLDSGYIFKCCHLLYFHLNFRHEYTNITVSLYQYQGRWSDVILFSLWNNSGSLTPLDVKALATVTWPGELVLFNHPGCDWNMCPKYGFRRTPCKDEIPLEIYIVRIGRLKVICLSFTFGLFLLGLSSLLKKNKYLNCFISAKPQVFLKSILTSRKKQYINTHEAKACYCHHLC